jgi:carotenoid cleavage dioxygenase
MASVIERTIRSGVSSLLSGISAFNRRWLPVPEGPYPYFTGLHEPAAGEYTVENLAVTGALPPGLDGRYLRMGPNPVHRDTRGHHWFIGDGMVHGVRLQGGQARWYRNRYVRSRKVAAALKLPMAPGPHRDRFDNVNTAIVPLGGAAWALVEAGSAPVRFSEDLERHAYDAFGGTLQGPFSAHPHRDPVSGDLHAITYQGNEPDCVRHVVVDATGRVRRELRIPIAHGPMVHDCAVTERHVVILDLPVTFSMKAMLSGQVFPYRWNPAHPARVGLLPKDGTAADVTWIPVDPCFVFHTANAHDAPDGTVVLDAVVYDRMFDGSTHGPCANPRGLERWTIDPAARTVGRRLIDAAPQEFPRIDDRRSGLPHRFVYTLGLPDPFTPHVVGASHLFKHDLRTGERSRHEFGEGRAPGEFVFVPRHATAAEDDGWLVGLVVDVAAGATDLAVLDAARFEDEPVASVRIPYRVPVGFHGNWFPATPGGH